MLYYSPSLNTRFDTGFHSAEQIPTDAYEISQADMDAMMAGQTIGKHIVAVAGRWALIDPPPPPVEQLWAGLRGMRNAKLDVASKLVSRHRDQKEIGGSTNLTDSEYAALLVFCQELRDLPATVAAGGNDPTPGNFTWPTSPV